MRPALALRRLNPSPAYAARHTLDLKMVEAREVRADGSYEGLGNDWGIAGGRGIVTACES